jgi:hypothetical protein
LRRLLTDFITAVRERPFSYKIAYCREVRGATVDATRLCTLYDRTDYLMGRTVLADAIRRHLLPVPMAFLGHIAKTANRYLLKDVLLTLQGRPSRGTLLQLAQHPLCQDDSLMHFLLLQAARAHGIDPNTVDLHIHTEQPEFTDAELHTWRLWRPLDEAIAAVNDLPNVAVDTLRLMLYDNREPLAEELASDLSDVFNIDPSEIRHLTSRRLVSLLAKYVDLTYMVCHALSQGDLALVEERLAKEGRIQPRGVLLSPGQTDAQSTRGGDQAPGETEDRGLSPTDAVYPEESLLGADEGLDESLDRPTPPESIPPTEESTPGVEPFEIGIDDIHVEPAWTRLIPRVLAEELLVIPLHVEGDPPQSITLGCGSGDFRAITAHLGNLGCSIHCVHLPGDLVREAIRRHY